MIVVFVSSHDEVLLSSLQAHSSHWLGSITGYVDVCHVVILVASLSLVVGVHGREQAALNLRRVLHVHFTWVKSSLPFVNWGFSLHCSVVVACELRLTWIFSQLMNLCIIVIITLLVLLPVLKVLFGSVVTQHLLLLLVVLVLANRRSSLGSILFVISFVLFLLHLRRSCSLNRLDWSGVLGRRVIIVGMMILEFVFGVFIGIVHRI